MALVKPGLTPPMTMLHKVYRRLLAEYGPQGWWPLLAHPGANPTRTGTCRGYHPGDYTCPRDARARFEIACGAILTQNTAWPNVEAALRNLDHAPSPAEVLRVLAGSDKQLLLADAGDGMKAPELEQLRLNAVNCMAVWLADVKSLSIPALSDALFLALWRPRATELEHEGARLRALTEIEELAGVGLVCEEYRRQAAEKLSQAEMATREAAALRDRVQRLEQELREAQDTIEAEAANREASAAAHASALEALKVSTETEAAHLRDDVELLRTRVLRRLKADVDLLELGLEALRRPEPKVHVMMDSAERVADALRKELKNLQGGD